MSVPQLKQPWYADVPGRCMASKLNIYPDGARCVDPCATTQRGRSLGWTRETYQRDIQRDTERNSDREKREAERDSERGSERETESAIQRDTER